MKYISLFSGIEAATVAWQTLGWEPVAYAEIEPFPKAVLKHHYPNVPDLGDMTKVNSFQDQLEVPVRTWHGLVYLTTDGKYSSTKEQSND